MNASMQWLVPDKVLYWKMSGTVHVDNFRAGLLELDTILEEANHKIHVIVNARNARSIEGNAGYIKQLTRRVARHVRMGCFFVISYDLAFKYRLNRVTVDFGTHLRYSNNFRNTWYSLHNIDSSLPYIAPELPKIPPARKSA